MSITEIRKRLHRYIDKADNRFLKMVYAMMEEYTGLDEVVGYTVEGKPITRQQLKKRVEESEARIDSGKFISQEDLEKESEDW